MAGTPFLTSEIVIGDMANKISIAPDGSMTFTDPYVPPIKLKDITDLASPPLLVYVDETDAGWVALPVNSYGQILYKITITHNLGLSSMDDPNN
jgi:hypothetical protein